MLKTKFICANKKDLKTILEKKEGRKIEIINIKKYNYFYYIIYDFSYSK
jgi:hypothetical protein